MNITLPSYPKVWNLGHPHIEDLFDGEVVIQEKVDGSQFSFGQIGGQLLIRSKGAQIHPPTKDKLFKRAVDTVVDRFERGILIEGMVYRGEAMCGPKHNTLAYDSFPESGIILYDVDIGPEARIDSHWRLSEIAKDLEVDRVPELWRGTIENIEDLRQFLGYESYLGGPKVEGIVIKNYNRWGRDGKMLMGKWVSEAFREKHAKEWGKSNPGTGDVVARLQDRYTTDRRWEKAVEYLRDSGTLENSVRDIGPLINRIKEDVKEEEEEEIKEILFREFWPKIQRGLTRGFPEWYKNRLAESQFDD